MQATEDSDIVTFNGVPPSFISSMYGSIVISEDKNLICFGKNKKGFLGQEEINEIIYPPRQIPNLMNIKMVDCGLRHTVCIDYDGNMFTFGNNDCGQLGIGKDENELPFTHIPQQIIDIPPIDSISCGDDFTVCITNERTLYSFGDNKYGQLGIGSCKQCISPQLINDLNDIEFIQCSRFYCICKTYTNEIYSWGGNTSDQLGHGHTKDCNKPHIYSNWPSDIIDIKSGDFHLLLLSSKGYVYSLGYNHNGYLGLNDDTIKLINIPTLIKDLPLITRIECGYTHSMCIDINNKLWLFGNNEYGQLGLGDKKIINKPTLNNSIPDIIDVSSRGYHTFVKTMNNGIYTFGYNRYSQIGMKTSQQNQLIPIQVFKDVENIWRTNIRRSKQKSARK